MKQRQSNYVVKFSRTGISAAGETCYQCDKEERGEDMSCRSGAIMRGEGKWVAGPSPAPGL